MSTPPSVTSGADDGQDVLGRRIAAGLVDVAVFFALLFVVGAIPGLGHVIAEDGSISSQLSGVGFLVYIVIVLGYYYALESTTGKTLGKALLGLRVVATGGGPPTPRAVAIRTVLRIVDALPFLYLVGFITMLAATPRGRRVGDLVAKTAVVRG